MTQKMVCPPSPLGYTQYERRYYAGRLVVPGSPDSPWQLCVEDGDDDTSNDETDTTLEYMCDLLEAREIDPDEFRRQMRNEGYNEEVIRNAIWNHWDHAALSAGQ